MPHKHTRRPRDSDSSIHDLPPTTLAKPLPVTNSKPGLESAKRKRKAQSQKPQDDTPRAFARLLYFQQNGRKPPSGLDNGEQRARKKAKLSLRNEAANVEQRAAKREADSSAPKPSAQQEKLTILPGERLSAFSARVNQALPIAGLSRKGKSLQKLGLGKEIKERQTKMEKRMQKMQAEWRAEDAKRKEREAEAKELAEEEEEEHWGVQGVSDHRPIAGKRKSKRKRRLGETSGIGEDENGDPWAKLKLARGQPRGLHDYAQEPPKLKGVREKLKVRNGAGVDVADVPSAAGSLRRREELGGTRRDIIANYRAIMQTKRDQA